MPDSQGGDKIKVSKDSGHRTEDLEPIRQDNAETVFGMVKKKAPNITEVNIKFVLTSLIKERPR